MINGRHLILVGIIACAGLLSVHAGQRQIELGYQLGGMEKDLREIRGDIELCKIRCQALQSPKAVADRAAELKLPLQPVTPPTVVLPAELHLAPVAPENHSLGSPQGAHNAASHVETGARRTSGRR